MNEFVDECRREWKRLGVPRAVSDEMATELAADLDEGTVAEVLGSDATDARSFARSWATERGVIRDRGRSRVRVALALLALLALVPTVIGAVLTIRANESGPERLALPPPPSLAAEPRRQRLPAPAPNEIAAQLARDRAVVLSDRARLLVRAGDEDDNNTAGIVFLLVGLGMLVPATLFWSGRVALDR